MNGWALRGASWDCQSYPVELFDEVAGSDRLRALRTSRSEPRGVVSLTERLPVNL